MKASQINPSSSKTSRKHDSAPTLTDNDTDNNFDRSESTPRQPATGQMASRPQRLDNPIDTQNVSGLREEEDESWSEEDEDDSEVSRVRDLKS